MTLAEFELEFSEAMRLRSTGSYDGAVQLLIRLLDAGHHRAAVVGMLGITLQYDLTDPGGALPFLRESVALAPQSERFSLGLFHALLALDQEDEAFDEMRRYLKDHTSDAYDEFLRDVNTE